MKASPLGQATSGHVAHSTFFSERVGIMSLIGLVKALLLGVDTLLHSLNACIKAN